MIIQSHVGGGLHASRLGKPKAFSDVGQLTDHTSGLQLAQVRRGGYPNLGVLPDANASSMVGGSGMGRIFSSVLRERLMPALWDLVEDRKKRRKRTKRGGSRGELLSDLVSKKRAKKRLEDARTDVEAAVKSAKGGRKKGGGGGGSLKGLSKREQRKLQGLKSGEESFYEKTSDGGSAAPGAAAEIAKKPVIQSCVTTAPSKVKQSYALI